MCLYIKYADFMQISLNQYADFMQNSSNQYADFMQNIIDTNKNKEYTYINKGCQYVKKKGL